MSEEQRCKTCKFWYAPSFINVYEPHKECSLAATKYEYIPEIKEEGARGRKLWAFGNSEDNMGGYLVTSGEFSCGLWGTKE